MKKTLFLLACLLFAIQGEAQVKKEIAIPNIQGYKTLKCDLHIHTVFSDGLVWPTVRIDEAYNEGLDAIAITDHLEYRPHHTDIPSTHNRSHEIAKPSAERRDIILIKGSEITKSKMPPGHFNAIFINDSDPMDHEDYLLQMAEAKKQNGFIFWNHPGWRAQQAETVWWDAHTEIYNKGYMQGIEVYNYKDYYPEAHQWALDKKLTILCNTDVHDPIGTNYDLHNGHRPMTLIFARERTEESIKEALLARRTAAYFDDILVAEEIYLKELFENAIELIDISRKGNSVKITLMNKSDIPFHIKRKDDNMQYANFTIPAMKRISINAQWAEGKAGSSTTFEISNLYAKPNEGLQYTLRF